MTASLPASLCVARSLPAACPFWLKPKPSHQFSCSFRRNQALRFPPLEFHFFPPIEALAPSSVQPEAAGVSHQIPCVHLYFSCSIRAFLLKITRTFLRKGLSFPKVIFCWSPLPPVAGFNSLTEYGLHVLLCSSRSLHHVHRVCVR